MQLELRPFGTQRAAARMAAIGERLDDPRPLMEAISEDLADIGERRFRTGGDGEWDKLKRSTIERKHSARIGVDTGKLAGSLSQDHGGGTSRRIITRQGVMVWKTTAPYAFWGPRRGNREWFKLQPRDRRKIERKIERWLIRGRFR